MSAQELVGFVVPMHNAQRTIERTLASLLAQCDPGWIAIVVDDGSTDASAQIVRTINDPRITLHTQPNRGVSSARNAGFSLMETSFVCFLDADDTLDPEFISRMLPIAEQSEHGAVCACDYLDPDARQILPASIPSVETCSMRSLLALDCPAIMSIVHRRSSLQSIARNGTLFDESLDAFEDLDMLIRLHRSAQSPMPWEFVRETLAHYWITASSLSSDSDRVHECGKEILRRYAPEDHNAMRSWTLRSLAASIAADDRDAAERHASTIGRLDDADCQLLESQIRWQIQRRYAIAEDELHGRIDAVRAIISAVLAHDPCRTMLDALVSAWDDRWTHAIRSVHASCARDARLVIYGLGRNGRRVLDACDTLGIDCFVIDDDPSRIPADVRRIELSKLSSMDAVLVTPDDSEMIVERVRTLTRARVWTIASAIRRRADAPARSAGA
jgi:glycosyltransferase involved in cell wall biosynthesis